MVIPSYVLCEIDHIQIDVMELVMGKSFFHMAVCQAMVLSDLSLMTFDGFYILHVHILSQAELPCHYIIYNYVRRVK